MNSVPKASLLFHTIRYITLWQMIYRGRAMVLRRWRLLRGQRAPRVYGIRLKDFVPLWRGFQEPLDHEGIGGVEEAFKRGLGVAEGRFPFLNQEVCYKDEVKWQDPSVSQLWRYHLHYFDYVEDLMVWAAASECGSAWETFRRLASSWISHNRRLQGDGWHPYTVSLRIVNWMNALGFWRQEIDRDPRFSESFLSSLYGQARYLAENLEHDVRGNHLLKNIKALVWAGTAFAGGEASKWRQKGMKLLQKELNEQVLSDGGHFERSPGYHGVVLADCLEIGLWLRRNEGSAPQWLDEAVSRMLGFLQSILPWDHQLPLLKDTVRGEGRPPDALFSAGVLYLDRPALKITDHFALYPWLLFGKRGREQFSQYGLTEGFSGSKPLSDSGFFVLRDDEKRDYLVLDAGKPCPDYLPAHAHADLFSYELMVDGQRVVVDSGVYEYAAGKWRDYFRSTRAHNTVEIAGKNQSEVWGSFRVARRARPGLNNYTDSKERTVIDAWHDGYQRLGIPVMHRRILWWEKGLFWFVLDEICGRGRVDTKNFVHIHPSLGVNLTEHGGFQIRKQSGNVLGIQSFGNDAQKIITGREDGDIQGWYSEKFGKKTPNPVLCFQKEAELPFCFGYVLYPGEDLVVQYSQTGSRMYRIRLMLPERTIAVDIEPGKVTHRS